MAFSLPIELSVAAPAELSDTAVFLLTKALDERFPGRRAYQGQNAQCVLELTEDGVPASEQGYSLTVKADGIRIRSRAPQGLFYGLQTLCNLIVKTQSNALPGCEIQDEPGLPWRGFHLDVSSMSNATVPDFCKIFDTLGSLKMNVVQLAFGTNLPLKDSPFTLQKDPLTQESIDLIKAAAARNFVTIIPQLQLLTHARWLTTHPEFYQKISNKKSYKRLWDSSICPYKPLAMELSKYTLAETIRIFQPKYLHICYDEFFLCHLAECDFCEGGHDPVELAKFARMFVDLTRSYGVEPIIYQDSMHPDRASNDSTWKPLLEAMPRDIALDFWDYDVVPRLDHYKYFQNHGFQNIYGVSFTSKLLNTRSLPLMIYDNGGKGIMLTYWGWVWSHFTKYASIDPDGAAGTTVTAEYGWNPDNRLPLTQLRWDPAFELHCRMGFGHPDRTDRRKYAEIAIQDLCNIQLGNDRNFPKLNAQVRDAMVAEAKLSAEKYNLSPVGKDGLAAVVLTGLEGKDGYSTDAVTIPVGTSAKGVSLLVMGGSPGNVTLFDYNHHYAKPLVCVMQVNYEDGLTIQEEIKYKVHFNEWNADSSAMLSRFVVRLPDAKNRQSSLMAYDWDNPHPEKAIKSLTLTPKGESTVAFALLAAVAVDPKDGYTPRTVEVPKKLFRAESLHTLENIYQESSSVLDLSQGMPQNCKVIFEGKMDGKPAYQVNPATKELEIQMPPVIEKRSRLCVDVTVPKGTPCETILVAFNNSLPEACKHSGLYRGTAGFKSFDVDYDFHGILDNEPGHILLSHSLGMKHDGEGTETNPAELSVLRFSLWFENKEPLTVKICDIRVNAKCHSYSEPTSFWQ